VKIHIENCIINRGDHATHQSGGRKENWKQYRIASAWKKFSRI